LISSKAELSKEGRSGPVSPKNSDSRNANLFDELGECFRREFPLRARATKAITWTAFS